MGARGPAPKLRAVREREGKLAHRPLPEGLKLPPSRPGEPDWSEWFAESPPRLMKDTVLWPGRDHLAVARLSGQASELWRRWSKALDAYGVLSDVDDVLALAAVSFIECREATRQGRSSDALKWMAQFVAIAGKVGLHPSARDQLNPRDPSPANSGWD